MLLERGGAESWGIEGTLMMEESAQNCATVPPSTSSLLGTTIQQSIGHEIVQGTQYIHNVLLIVVVCVYYVLIPISVQQAITIQAIVYFVNLI